GYYEPSRMTSEINYNPRVHDIVWMILLNAVIINGRQYSFGRREPMGERRAVIDSGTSTILMPLADLNRIRESIPGAIIDTTPYDSYISADCNTQLNFF